jgi:hypothetical protein
MFKTTTIGSSMRIPSANRVAAVGWLVKLGLDANKLGMWPGLIQYQVTLGQLFAQWHRPVHSLTHLIFEQVQHQSLGASHQAPSPIRSNRLSKSPVSLLSSTQSPITSRSPKPHMSTYRSLPSVRQTIRCASSTLPFRATTG